MKELVRVVGGDDPKIMSVIRNKWLQTGLAGVPFVGGPIQTFLSSALAEIDRKRLELLCQKFEARLDELEASKIDISYLSSEDFVVRLRSIYGIVVAGADDAKLNYLRDYLVGCAVNVSIDVTWKDLFLRYLQEMTGAHLLLLHEFYLCQQSLSYGDRFELPQRIPGSPLSVSDLHEKLPAADKVLIELLAADLAARGLIGRWAGSPSEPLAWSVTDSGLKLMKFLHG